MRFSPILVTAIFCSFLAAAASAADLTVPGQANIFGAGHAVPPAPGGELGGVLPPSYSFAAGAGQVLTFSSVTGTVTCCSSDLITYGTGPDGGPWATGTTDITSYGGVSGIVHGSRTMFLVGVFLTEAEPTDPAPARLDFSAGAYGDGFSAIAPAIGQTFFVGDGMTGTGTGLTQQFMVPSNATRLYLGFADAADFGAPSSAPGYYGDNAGQLMALLDVTTPQPTASRNGTWGRLKTIYR
ncbi:MAG: hypothetical protein ABIU54_13295 [Candidatus Eisenbacteria bacterium]